jgi:hypothetical protein
MTPVLGALCVLGGKKKQLVYLFRRKMKMLTAPVNILRNRLKMLTVLKACNDLQIG